MAFTLLVHLPFIKQFHIGPSASSPPKEDNSQPVRDQKSSEDCYDTWNVVLNPANIYENKLDDDRSILKRAVENYGSTDDLIHKRVEERQIMMNNGSKISKLRRLDWWYLLIIQGYCCSLTNGIMPSIQSYSTLPYGNLAYHLAITLGLMMIPTASLCVHWLPAKSNISIGILTVIGTAVACYITACAAMSPYPPLCGSPWGGVVSVIAWLLFNFIITYIKVSIGGILRHEGRNALILYGGVTQIGSLCGAVLIFPLINILHLFEPNDPCIFICY
uniref:Riboflavin transporter n=1 Tax=Saccoglossus kowalevskii TaxID=10224 RepID=A0ABM0GMJ1_SACKO|nr:PREDICTED: riboflavin transporter 2-like [Saccoglossus kowalevskii]